MQSIWFAFLILIPSLIWGQKKTWSVNDCMRYAVEHHQDRHKQDAQNKITQYNYQEAIARLLPSLGASTSATMNFGRNVDADYNSTTDKSFYNRYDMSSSMVLFSGWSNITRVKIEKVNKLKGVNELQDIVDMLAYDVMTRYYNALYLKSTIELSEKKYQASTHQLTQVQRMEELGMKASLDVFEFEAQQASDELQLIRQQNLLTIELIRLKEQMNYPIDEQLDLADSIPKQLKMEHNDALGIYEKAVLFLPKALVSQQNLQMQQLNYKRAKGQLYPSLNFNGGLETNFSKKMNGDDYLPFFDQLNGKRGHYIGLSLNVPIFYGLSRSSEVRRARQQLKIQSLENEQTLRQLHSEIAQAVSDRDGLAQEYKQSQKQLKAKTEAHKQNVNKYANGLVSALELNISANGVLQVAIEQLNALYKYQVKQKLVDYYQGEPMLKTN